jgi:hypothetical protein
VFIGIVTAGVCNGIELDDAGGQVRREGAVDDAHQPVVGGHRGSESPGSAHLIENGGR